MDVGNDCVVHCHPFSVDVVTDYYVHTRKQEASVVTVTDSIPALPVCTCLGRRGPAEHE